MVSQKQFFVYILSSPTGVLYVGMTRDLKRRLLEHRESTAESFSKRYRTTRLIHYEMTGDVKSAIAREKEIKGWRRRKKLDLVRAMNPTFRDLSEDWLD